MSGRAAMPSVSSMLTNLTELALEARERHLSALDTTFLELDAAAHAS